MNEARRAKALENEAKAALQSAEGKSRGYSQAAHAHAYVAVIDATSLWLRAWISWWSS